MEGFQQGSRVVFVFLNIDIVHSSILLGSGVERFQLFNDFYEYTNGKISGHKGHKVNWGKDGGIFLFGGRDTKENYMYHDAVLSAVDILDGLNGFNMRRASPEEDIKVRIAIHSGEAIYHDDLTRIESEELTILAKNERKIGLENAIVITDKVFNQLSIRSKIKAAFHNTNRKFEDLSLYSYPKFEPVELSYKYRDVYREQGFGDFMKSVINDVNIESIDIIAHTGAVTVERFFSEIDKNKNKEASKRFKNEVSIRILLRDPESENEDRSTSINRMSRKIDNDYKGKRGYKVKKNFYHCMPVFNSVLCKRVSDSEKDVPRRGNRLGFLSFYHFPNRAEKSEAHDNAFIIDERKTGDNGFIDVYDSWFEHFWGESDDIHTIIFDFDDTIADSHNIQIDAWVETVLNVYKRHNLEPGDFNQEFMASIIASATPVPAVPGKSTAALAEKGVTGLSQTLNSPDGSVNHYDFFIAYATPDRPKARSLYWSLLDASCKVFLDVENLRPGALWQPMLREALEASRAIVVLVSTQADDAFYQQEEIVRAIQLARDKSGAHTVIPIILEKLPQGTGSIPYGLSGLQAQDATRSGGLERAAAEIVAWLKEHRLDAKQPKVADAMIEAEFIDFLGHPGSLNRDRTRNEIAKIFFEEQRSEHIFLRIFSIKDEKKKVAIFNERRRLRMRKMSDNKPDSFTGAVDVLDHLSRDYNIALISDTYEEVITNFLDEEKLRNGETLRSKFTYIMGSEKSVLDVLDLDRSPGKGALLRKIVNIIGVPRQRLVYVGDSKYDYQACREIGIDFIEARLFPELLRRYTGKYTFLDSEPSEKHPCFTEWVDFVSALLEVKKSKSQSYRC